MRDSFIGRLLQLARLDDRIFLITGDLGFKVLDEYIRELPRQFLNVGVAEQNLASVAAGLAHEGRCVFTYSIGNFPLLRCFEQIRNDIAYHGLDVKTVSIGGGFSYGQLGFSHHATEDLACARSLAGMTVVAPCDRWEAAEATEALIRRPGPAFLRLDKGFATEPPRPDERFALGQARMLRTGEALTMVCCGGVLAEVITAADRLAAKGHRCRVLSMHTVKPLDEAAVLAAARETGGILTVEEHTLDGGLGSAVAEVLLDGGSSPRRFRRLGLRNEFPTVVGTQEYLRSHFGLDGATIEGVALQLISSER